MNLAQPKFKPYKSRHVNGGIQHIFKFENKFGASVASHDYTYGNQDHWELAVIKFKEDGENFDLVYYTPITSDVIGWLSWEGVEENLEKIKDLIGEKNEKI